MDGLNETDTLGLTEGEIEGDGLWLGLIDTETLGLLDGETDMETDGEREGETEGEVDTPEYTTTSFGSFVVPALSADTAPIFMTWTPTPVPGAEFATS